MTDGPGPAGPDELRGPEWEGWESAQHFAPVIAPSAPIALSARAQGRPGRVAMIMAIWVIAISVVWSVLVGHFGTTVYHYNDVTSQSVHVGFNAQPNLVATGIQILLGSVFGIWALVQGIIATATNRGRKFGVVAIVLSGAAPILSVIIWTIVGVIAGTSVNL